MFNIVLNITAITSSSFYPYPYSIYAAAKTVNNVYNIYSWYKIYFYHDNHCILKNTLIVYGACHKDDSRWKRTVLNEEPVKDEQKVEPGDIDIDCGNSGIVHGRWAVVIQ